MSHSDQHELNQMLAQARKKVEVGALYKHYKSDELYRVTGMGLWEETQEVCVMYQALYGKGILWIRPINVFLEEMEYEGKKITKFTKAE